MPAETHSHGAPIDPRDIAALVCERLAEVLAIDLDAVTPDSRLREDLDADDYALGDVLDLLAEELDERTVGADPGDAIGEIVTVDDLCALVAARYGGDAR